VGMVCSDEPQTLPNVQKQRDKQQHRRRHHDDLESDHPYLAGAVGVVPMNGSGVFGVRYCGSWPFHLLIA